MLWVGWQSEGFVRPEWCGVVPCGVWGFVVPGELWM